MKISIYILMFILILVQVCAVDYLDEFSFEGYNCIYVDEFSYLKGNKEYNVSIIGCCNPYDCFYAPINIEQQMLYDKNFRYLLQIESARQNIYKRGLSEDIFRFEEFFDICKMLNVEPPRDQIIGGVVDITDQSMPYLINANKAKSFHNTISVLRNFKIVSKFNLITFTISSACSSSNGKEEEVLGFLSQCYNNFQNIKYGRIGPNNLNAFDSCLSSLKSATKRQGGFWGDLKEITYYLSSLLTGGNIVDFVRTRMPNFEEYQRLFNEDVVKIDLSIESLNNRTELLKTRIDQFETSIKKLKENISRWEKFLSWMGFQQTNVTQKIKDLNIIKNKVKDAKKNWQYKTAHALLDEGFIEVNNTYSLQQELNYPIRNNLFCGYNKAYYDILEESIGLETIYYNKTVLVNQELNEPKVRFLGLNPKTGCTTEDCALILSFRNDPYDVLIDFNATILIEDELNETKIYKNLLIENLNIPPNAYQINRTINFDGEHFLLKVVNISDITITIKPNENYFYREIPFPNITIVPNNKIETVFDERIYCGVQNI